jgi:WD40 repeat protein
LNM